MFFLQPASYTSPPLDGASNPERTIVSTLLYYDLFSFPTRAAELVRFAHGAGLHESDLAPQSPWWSSLDGYWCLRGREAIVAARRRTDSASQAKLGLAGRWARGLQWVPGVRFVGVTGSLAMQAAAPEDDIDLLIITRAGQLWLTRALVLAWLWATGVKRTDNGRMEHPDQACANVFLSEDGLSLPDHNLFIAHEICQMLPLVGPPTYARFLQANPWVRTYLPQWVPNGSLWEDSRALRGVQRLLEAVLRPLSGWLERQVARHQLARIGRKHARGHNAQVKICATQLRFNPCDHAQEIMATFGQRWDLLSLDPLHKGPTTHLDREHIP